MNMTFRWYGPDDPVSLGHIRQIPGITGIVTAVYTVPVGEVWPREEIASLKRRAEEKGLAFEVVESVPVHEDIKLGAPGCERFIENYCENVRRLGEAGVKCICYNFMPVFDWTRSELSRKLPDGSYALAYDEETVRAIDPVKGELRLPGWDESYTKEELWALLQRYSQVTGEDLWRNLGRFLDGVIPVCEEAGVNLAIHPDDPPWPIFGLPRIITGADSYERLFALNESPRNGVTLCFGSLAADPQNDLEEIIRRFGPEHRFHFVHARNIKHTGGRSFEEAAHLSLCGSLDMAALLTALYETGFDGYIRPDHGRMIWGEKGRPGYGLYDRALGACYLTGLWEAISKR